MSCLAKVLVVQCLNSNETLVGDPAIALAGCRGGGREAFIGPCFYLIRILFWNVPPRAKGRREDANASSFIIHISHQGFEPNSS